MEKDGEAVWTGAKDKHVLAPGGESIDDFNYATYSGTPAPASYGRNSGSGEWYYQAATPCVVNTDGTDVVTGLQ